MFISLLRTHLEKMTLIFANAPVLKLDKDPEITFLTKCFNLNSTAVQASLFQQKNSKFTHRHKTSSTDGTEVWLKFDV